MQTMRDPGLEDMLSDPLIQLLMSSDHVCADDARALWTETAARLRVQRSWDKVAQCGREASRPPHPALPPSVF
ncbi:hypothetical protein NK718_16565 [Alsobacter sp. SYSU M60028]|uniref:Uncharacterized protein n=1 Tax=Alsobacter ponti TaxID=2962936 RepID=A0ABT1LF66_9HYPH|nr:hypothetical protein [Alsobacter ponti]MCP8940142.1 hypothetical protein [Alsobacter ponti]